MNLSDLLKKDLVRQDKIDKKRAHELLILSGRDIKTAEDNFKNRNYDWVMAITYNAMLSAGRAMMAAKGYRPSAEAHHLAVVQFCAAVLPSDAGMLVATFNRYRIKRHEVIYEESEIVGIDEAKNAIENSKRFVRIIKERLEK